MKQGDALRDTFIGISLHCHISYAFAALLVLAVRLRAVEINSTVLLNHVTLFLENKQWFPLCKILRPILEAAYFQRFLKI